MRIGLPRELKDGEFRVALAPGAARELAHAGHDVCVERGLGAGAGFPDPDYAAAGARLADRVQEVWDCELIVKVKELQQPEYGRPRRGQMLFCFQHFGPAPRLLDAALASGATFLAFETVGEADGSLPLLAPMSAIAGRLSVPIGTWCLQKQNGGSGVLLSGLDGVAPGHIVILGAGNVGSNALAMAHGIGAHVTVFASTDRRFASLRARFPEVEFRVGTDRLPDAAASSDLIIGAVLRPGQMSPKLVTRAMLRSMRAGSALVDVGIDQGGIAETSRPSSHSQPIYLEERVVHYCVPNMPAACARTASLALDRAVLPYVLELAGRGLAGALAARPDLETAVQVHAGKVTHEHLARDTRRAHVPLEELVA